MRRLALVPLLLPVLLVGACGASAKTAAASETPGPTSGAGPTLTLALGSSFTKGVFLKSSTCDDASHDYSPALNLTATGAAGLAVTMVDLDNGKVHWIQTGIPGSATSLTEHTLTSGAKEWVNDFKEATYDGPCPPAGSTHRYGLTLYSVPASVDLSAAATPTDEVAMLTSLATDHIEVVAAYTRA